MAEAQVTSDASQVVSSISSEWSSNSTDGGEIQPPGTLVEHEPGSFSRSNSIGPVTSASTSPPHSAVSQSNKVSKPLDPWRSKLHHGPNLLSLLLTTVITFAAIVVVLVISVTHDGVLNVSESRKVVGQISIGPKIAWTTIPGILFNLYNLWVATTLQAMSTRQPYVELKDQQQGAPASQSILLDYNAYMRFTAWYHALFKHKHRILGACMLLQLIFGFVAGPFGSSLLTANVVSQDQKTVSAQQSIFNEEGLTGNSDLIPVLGTVSSTQFYGGKPPSWVLPNHGFADIELPKLSRRASGTTNWTVSADALSVGLACAPLDPEDFKLNNTDVGLVLSTTDRGCQLDLPVQNATKPGYKYFMPTLYKGDCGPDINGTRLVVLGALRANESLSTLSNFSGTSCTTTYYESHGDLSVLFNDIEGVGSPILRSFNPNNSTVLDPRPLYANTLEFAINQPSNFDNTATLTATDFGRLVFTYAQKIHGDQGIFTGAALTNATEQIYSAIFPLVVRQYLLQPAPSSPASADTLQRGGRLAVNRTRLVVVMPVAGVLLVFLALIAAEVGWTWWYVKRRPAALYEEPVGLLSAAGALRGSEILDDYQRLVDRGDEGGENMDVRKRWEKDDDLKGSRWAIGCFEDPKMARLVRVRDKE